MCWIKKYLESAFELFSEIAEVSFFTRFWVFEQVTSWSCWVGRWVSYECRVLLLKNSNEWVRVASFEKRCFLKKNKWSLSEYSSELECLHSINHLWFFICLVKISFSAILPKKLLIRIKYFQDTLHFLKTRVNSSEIEWVE